MDFDRSKLSPRVQAALDEIDKRREARAEAHEERDADRWLKSIDVRELRQRRAEEQAIFDAEDNDPDYQSTRRMWEAITRPGRFVRRVKTAAQLEREERRRVQAAANLVTGDPMLWR
jgi:hypothetical protein